MSYIANALDKEIKASKTTAANLSRTSGINEAQISRIRNGDQIWVSSIDLVNLARGLHPDKTESYIKAHARLLYARLQDECGGPGAKLIEVAIHDGNGKLPSAPPKVMLPPAIQRDLDVIVGSITKNRNVRDLIASIAKLCKPLPQARAEQDLQK